MKRPKTGKQMDVSIPAADIKIEVQIGLKRSYLQIRSVGRASKVTEPLRIAILRLSKGLRTVYENL